MISFIQGFVLSGVRPLSLNLQKAIPPKLPGVSVKDFTAIRRLLWCSSSISATDQKFWLSPRSSIINPSSLKCQVP